MQRSTLMLSMLGALALAIIYDQIKINTGMEIKLLLCASIAVMIVGLYIFWKKPKETTEGEA